MYKIIQRKRQKADKHYNNKDFAINVDANSLYFLPYETTPIQKFNSAMNAVSEASNGPRSMSQCLAIVNWGGKQENGNFQKPHHVSLFCGLGMEVRGRGEIGFKQHYSGNFMAT